ncbi:flavin reductase family protein [Bacteroidota bacterium]
MTEPKHNSSRRVFVKQAAALSLLTAGGTFGFSSCISNKTGGKRKELEEAGPMLPPVPAVLLTAKGTSERPDEISVVWSFVLEGKPPQVGISVHKDQVVGDLVKKHKEFVLNVPVADIVKQFDIVDMNSTKILDKFELSGLSRGQAMKVDAPVVVESPIHLECKVINIVDIKPYRTLFIAEVVATTVLEGVCDKDGKLIVDDTPFFGMTSGSGEFYTMGEKVGRIGMSVGRTDIKY